MNSEIIINIYKFLKRHLHLRFAFRFFIGLLSDFFSIRKWYKWLSYDSNEFFFLFYYLYLTILLFIISIILSKLEIWISKLHDIFF